jgi:hypothetical protein
MEPGFIQPGDVILIGGKSWVSRGIKMFTNSPVSHVGIAVSGTHLIEATSAGVEKNKIEDVRKHADLFCVRRFPGLTVEQAELMKTKAYGGLLGQGYDFIQLVSLGLYFGLRKLGFTWHMLVPGNASRQICSELVANCFLTIPVKFRTRTKLVTPADLYSTGKLDTILEEKVTE